MRSRGLSLDGTMQFTGSTHAHITSSGERCYHSNYSEHSLRWTSLGPVLTVCHRGVHLEGSSQFCLTVVSTLRVDCTMVQPSRNLVRNLLYKIIFISFYFKEKFKIIIAMVTTVARTPVKNKTKVICH